MGRKRLPDDVGTPEQIERRKYNREYREKHIERIQKQERRYYQENKQRCNERQRQWRAENPDKVAQYGRTYWAKIRALIKTAREAKQ
jgi:hypothetical protein